jgi:hypothetical protein
MTPDKFKLINALASEYEYLCHDDFDPDEDPTPEEYKEMLMQMSYDELIEEASIDEHFTLDEYLEVWS